MNVHFHTLLPDGVFLLDGDGPARFVPLPPPRDEDLAAILWSGWYGARRGPLSLLLTPDELLARLATLVPPPRVHGVS